MTWHHHLGSMQAANDSNPLELPADVRLKTASVRWARHTISFRGERRASAGVARSCLVHRSLARSPGGDPLHGWSPGEVTSLDDINELSRIRALFGAIAADGPRELPWRSDFRVGVAASLGPGTRTAEPDAHTGHPHARLDRTHRIALGCFALAGPQPRKLQASLPRSTCDSGGGAQVVKTLWIAEVRWFPLRPWLSGPVGREGLSHTVHLRCPISSGVSAA
jgi:hypothetical protein